MATITIEPIDARGLALHVDDLAAVLTASVRAGAAISFVLPYTHDDARAFWMQQVQPSLGQGGRVLWGATIDARVVGTVQLLLDMPPNQPHRSEVTKLVVHPDYRGRGLAKRLMAALEAEARARGKGLITLDTRTGDHAEPLYHALGYRSAGVIPGFALDPDGGRRHATTYMYKTL